MRNRTWLSSSRSLRDARTIEGRAALVPDPDPELDPVHSALHRSTATALSVLLERVRHRLGNARSERAGRGTSQPDSGAGRLAEHGEMPRTGDRCRQ